MEQNFEQSIPFAPIVAGFLIIMLVNFVVRKRLRTRALIRQGQFLNNEVRVRSIEERVANNPAWKSGEIRSGGRALIIIVWIGVVAWGLSVGAPFLKSLSDPSATMGKQILLGVFTLLAVPLLIFAVRITRRQMRFGSSVCCISGKAGVVGKRMTGQVHTATEVEATGDYSIELQCTESYTVGSGKNRTRAFKIHWQAKQSLAHVGTSSRHGIPFSFDIPTFPPETGHQISRGAVSWQLLINAPSKDINYSAMFVVPVFRMVIS